VIVEKEAGEGGDFSGEKFNKAGAGIIESTLGKEDEKLRK